MAQTDDFFGERERVHDKLAYLYPWLRERRTKVESRDLAIIGIRKKVWPLLTRLEANIQLRTNETREYLRMQDKATGIPIAYKTQTRGRVPDAEITQAEMAFDIQEDVKLMKGDWTNLRKKIAVYWWRYKTRPAGVPDWIWSAADDDYMRGMLAQQPPMPPPQ